MPLDTEVPDAASLGVPGGIRPASAVPTNPGAIPGS